MIKFGARSDTGRVRENNEDRYGATPEIGLFVLSDGMGGMASGEVASRLAVDAIIEHCRTAAANSSLPFLGDRREGLSEATNRLGSAIRVANRAIYHRAHEDSEHQGMGATAVAVRFAGDRVSIAHAGDSRAYLLRGGKLEQLTSDHSFVAESLRRGMMTAQEAAESKLQNVLLRALGIEPDVEVDLREEIASDGDVFLLCSDGLTRVVTEPEIAGTLQVEAGPARAAEELIEMANERGGPDNITVVIVRLEKESKGWFSWLRRRAPKNSGTNGNAGGN